MKKSLLQTLFTSLISPPTTTQSRILSQGIYIFTKSQNDLSFEISGFSRKCLSVLEALIHPRCPPLLLEDDSENIQKRYSQPVPNISSDEIFPAFFQKDDTLDHSENQSSPDSISSESSPINQKPSTKKTPINEQLSPNEQSLSDEVVEIFPVNKSTELFTQSPELQMRDSPTSPQISSDEVFEIFPASSQKIEPDLSPRAHSNLLTSINPTNELPELFNEGPDSEDESEDAD